MIPLLELSILLLSFGETQAVDEVLDELRPEYTFLNGDEWALNGTKQFITSAEYAGIFVVWAVTDKSLDCGKGISCFLVEKGVLGLSISKAEEKMRQNASASYYCSGAAEGN